MKKFVFTLSMFLYGIVMCQVPQKLSYQAIIRDASNNIVSNQSVGIRISILQGTATGTIVYMETHNPMTNKDGLVSLEISGGTVVSGAFSAIDWSRTPYFLFTEVDPTGGTTYSIFSTTELMSVPYALFAERSGNPGPAGPQGIAGINGVGITNTQVVNDSLKVTLSNGNIINSGYVKGAKGDTGISVINTQVVNDSLKVTLSNGNIINSGIINKNIVNTHGIFFDTTKSILNNWVVPQNVSQINIVIVGSCGGNGGSLDHYNAQGVYQSTVGGGTGGLSGYNSLTVLVSSGDTIKYFLGANGNHGQNSTCSGGYSCCQNLQHGSSGEISTVYLNSEVISKVNGGVQGKGVYCQGWNIYPGSNGARGSVDMTYEFHPKTIYLNSNNTTLISNTSKILIRY